MADDILGSAPLGKAEEKVATNPALALSREATELQHKNIEAVQKQVAEAKEKEAATTGFREEDSVVLAGGQQLSTSAGGDKGEKKGEEREVPSGPPFNLQT